MAKTTARQRETAGRVMHEYKHGELKSGRRGKGGKVKNRKQAIAIALYESSASKYLTKAQKRKSASKSRRKEASGRTGQQEREGKSHVGARGRRESSRAMGGKAQAAPVTKAAARPAVRTARLRGRAKRLRPAAAARHR